MGLNRNLGNITEVIKESGGNIGIGVINTISSLQSAGTITVGPFNNASTVGNMQLVTGGSSPTSNRITYGTDGTGWRFAIGKNQGGTITDQLIINTNGNVLIGATTDTGDRLNINGNIRANSLITGLTSYDTNGLTIRNAANTANLWSINKGAGDGTENWQFYNFPRNSIDFSVNNSTGNVGIATSSPNSTLEVNTPLSIRSIFSARMAGVAGFEVRSVSTTNQPFMNYFFNNGNVGMGMTPNAARLTVNGMVTIGEFTNGTAWINAEGGAAYFGNGGKTTSLWIYNNGNYLFTGSNVSDIRAKKNIKDLEFNAIEKIIALQPKSYYMKNDESQIRYGLIAQDVHEVLPDLIYGDIEGEDYVGLDYNGLVPILIKAIQELKEEIEILKQNK